MVHDLDWDLDLLLLERASQELRKVLRLLNQAFAHECTISLFMNVDLDEAHLHRSYRTSWMADLELDAAVIFPL